MPFPLVSAGGYPFKKIIISLTFCVFFRFYTFIYVMKPA